jgi:hypothetical protein
LRHDLALEALHAQIEKIEGRSRHVNSVLPFGIAEVDSRLPGGGLALGALHEVAGGGNDAVNSAAAALFTAGIAARTRGKVLWCGARSDLFAPALAQAGLKPDRVIYLEAGDEKTILACFEECLTPDDWAMEAFNIAYDDVYGEPPLSKDALQHLDQAYVAQAEKDVALQLSWAGVRLAAVLNKALGRQTADAPHGGAATSR